MDTIFADTIFAVNHIAVGYPGKRTETTAAAEAVRQHCRGTFPHRDCAVVGVELRTYQGRRDYWRVALMLR